MVTRVEMIIETLKANPNRQFTARELAQEFIVRYPEEIAEKRLNPRYNTEDKLIAQLAAEIGGSRTNDAKKQCANLITHDKPRPRVYFWDSEQLLQVNPNPDKEPKPAQFSQTSEQALYPLLIEFLHEDMGLYCLRIDEKRSKNSHGGGGNRWLHPDIVALAPLDKGWDETVRSCVRNGNEASIRLWSFEVKKQLTKSNVRESFFQAVSNSSWANFGYLVAAESLKDNVEEELLMLSSLHGIGVLILNQSSLFDSEIIIPARERVNVDWQSINRIVTENSDFKHYIEQVSIYKQTGRLVKSIWNK